MPGGCLAGQKIGAYTLVSHLGQGGMGSVWLAERSDGRFERRVAIKFLSIGFSGRDGEQRFRREGKILGRLTHPHIAELADAGVSPEGQPYLVLEHVEGEYIDQYCDRRALDVRSRVVLFLDVLAGVAHAHNNLIVHRDIKPSNVLVRNDGQVKLLDFGISKLLEEEFEAGDADLRLPDPATSPHTLSTGTALTPSYASPEQIQGQPINTASDVYSLGVLLFELLTGERPYAGYPDSRAWLEKAAIEGKIERPSAAARHVQKANARGTTVQQLAALLKGDLDAIILKALSTQPDHRYPNADVLAQDIQRYLSRRPVLARPGSMWHRLKRFTCRNRLTVTVIAAVMLALAAGLFAVSWESRKARSQAVTTESVLKFMEDIFRLNAGSQANRQGQANHCEGTAGHQRGTAGQGTSERARGEIEASNTRTISMAIWTCGVVNLISIAAIESCPCRLWPVGSGSRRRFARSRKHSEIRTFSNRKTVLFGGQRDLDSRHDHSPNSAPNSNVLV